MVANYINKLMAAMDGYVLSRQTDEMATFRQMCKDERPDIVHVHAMSSFPAEGIRMIITPHGRQVDVNHAYVAIARSQMEARRINAPRIEIVRNPILTKTTTIDETARKLLRIYQKVMDSNVLELMNDETRKALPVLLKAGICGDRRWVENLKIGSPNWRQLAIYTYYEQVYHIMEHGAQVMSIDFPVSTVTDTTSYLPKSYKLIPEMSDSTVLQLLDSIHSGEVTMLRLTELDAALRMDDLDEEKLLKEIGESGYKQLFSSLLQILSEQTLLDEGFMPCTPIDNQDTARLRSNLKKHLSV